MLIRNKNEISDIRIFRRLGPFVVKRVLYAILGLFVLLGLLILTLICEYMYPDYGDLFIYGYAVLGIFIGWRIIRKGESKYRLAQIAMITDIVTGNEGTSTSRDAFRRAGSTFKYASLFSLVRNIIRHKNFKKVGQFAAVMGAGMVPYMGPCAMAWIFAHSNESHLRGACHAVSNYNVNRRKLTPVIFIAFMKEILFVLLLFGFYMTLGLGICYLVIRYVTDLDEIIYKFKDMVDAVEEVWNIYFGQMTGWEWNLYNIVFLVAVYLAWFTKVFTIRAYQMIDVIRKYLEAGEENPPSDALYNRLTAAGNKKQMIKGEGDHDRQ